ncbi:MAG: PBP1A family penicillin-binding protein [Candidatus Buchananbacteria bacterium]|nr:PBP1A family penicillin-binding protein [Candidatus Buchananbacteria bacterium]
MPIPGLSTKTTSPQNWRKPSRRLRQLGGSGFKKFPIYTGRSRGPKKLPENFTKLLLTFGGIFLAGLGIFSIILLAWIAKDLPNPNRIIDRSIALSTKIYDRTGETLLYDVHGEEKRTFIKLEEIPANLKNATLTAEDRKFYEHKGISVTGIIRSFIKNITTGSKVGGSTLTQQLVKNAILSPEKKYTRKIKEIILSYQIERKFSKDDILQMYFNEIPYGSVAYGAEAASQTYFGKSVKDLTLAESAVLAALPQAPTYYSPYGSHTDALFSRQHWILDSMAELGYITQEDANKAKEEKIEFKKRDENITAPHFVMYVREYLTEKYGELAVEQEGLTVITTLDLYKQKIAEEAVKEVAPKNAEQYNAHNAALVALDAKTGEVLAMVGSKDFFADPYPENCTPGKDCLFDPQVNAVLRLRQPGSSFKPIVYTAAFKKGYTPETVLYDVNTKFLNYDGRDYEPKNYDLGERGPLTIRKALQGSLNIPAVKAIYLTGVDNVIDLAEDLGYTSFSDRSRFGLSLVLGGGEVKMLEHVSAFATLAREGEWHAPALILEVRDKDGNVLEKFEKKEKKVLETQIARQINNVLSDNASRAYIFGESNYLTLGARPVAAKTGTTNDYRDAWTIGYTPSLAAGVWVGNNNNGEMKRGADGSIVAAPIWNKFMSRVLGDTPAEGFKEPDPIDTDKPVLNGSIAEGIKVKIDKTSGKLATEFTPESQIEEKTFRQIHSILYYINKDDPRGDTPPDLNSEQYKRWEEAVQAWAQKNNFVSEDPPTELDDVHTPQDQPSISITSPSSNQLITSRNFSASVNVSAPRGVRRVEYYLNNKLIKEVTVSPFNLEVFIEDPSIKTGFYTLKAVAYDDIDNNKSDEVELSFKLPAAPATLTWINPTASATVKTSAFPLTIKATLSSLTAIDKIDLFYTHNGQTNYINTARQFPSNQLSLQWLQTPEPGSYQIFASITNQDGFTYQSGSLDIAIE